MLSIFILSVLSVPLILLHQLLHTRKVKNMVTRKEELIKQLQYMNEINFNLISDYQTLLDNVSELIASSTPEEVAKAVDKIQVGVSTSIFNRGRP